MDTPNDDIEFPFDLETDALPELPEDAPPEAHALVNDLKELKSDLQDQEVLSALSMFGGFSQLLAEYIKIGGISTRRIARDTGIKRSRIEKIASDKVKPTTDEVRLLSDFCRIDALASGSIAAQETFNQDLSIGGGGGTVPIPTPQEMKGDAS